MVKRGITTKARLSVTIDENLMKEIDKRRGRLPTSIYINDLLAEFFKKKQMIEHQKQMIEVAV
jgi:metal-responsive CopG/Arc/MetJ family transcriptional regulator